MHSSRSHGVFRTEKMKLEESSEASVQLWPITITLTEYRTTVSAKL